MKHFSVTDLVPGDTDYEDEHNVSIHKVELLEDGHPDERVSLVQWFGQLKSRGILHCLRCDSYRTVEPACVHVRIVHDHLGFVEEVT